MKPIVDNSRTVTSNMDGESIKFGFDSSSIVHLQSLLSNQYSDPIRAVVRELSVNAIDANREAGSDKPINVTLPTPLNPVFTVEDSGTGMSLDTLRMVYTNYGASTKRDSNALVGMLGIGSKSPLAVADNFTVDTVRDGVRIVAVVRKDATGAAEMVIADTETTSAPNGTKISVPASGNSDWEVAADKTFKFFASGTVLIDGDWPQELGGIRVSDKVRLLDTRNRSGWGRPDNYVVMGGIAYRATEELWSTQTDGFSVVYTADIGEFTFTPSREELMDSDNNRARLADAKALIEKQVKHLLQHAELYFDSAGEALSKYVACGGVSYRSVLKWHGEKLAPYVQLGDDAWEWDTRYQERPRCRRIGSIDVTATESRRVVVNYDTTNTLSATSRKKIRKYAEDNGISLHTRWIITQELEDSPITDTIEVIDWADIKATKLTSGRKSSGKSKARTDAPWDVVIHGDESTIDTADLPSEAIVLSPTEYEEAHRFLSRHFKLTLVIAGKNRHARLGRLINVKTAAEFYRMMKDFIDPERELARSFTLDAHIERLDTELIEDKEFVRAIELSRSQGTEAHREYINVLNKFHAIQCVSREPRKNIQDVVRRYPLLYGYGLYNVPADHIITYINAIHNERIK